MTTILVTGGTGSLGRPTVELLRAAGHHVRVLSRKTGRDHVFGNLTTGEGLAAALEGVSTVLHLATAANSKDRAQTSNIIDASRVAGVSHLIYISIVGVDVIPYPYYRAKLACEKAIEECGIPFTILRATQFHSFISMLITAQKALPVIFAVPVSDQPIATEEVAVRLVELVAAKPSGHVTDIGGPEQLTLREAIGSWQEAVGTHKPIWMLHFFGKTIRAFKEGRHMTALPGYGRETFAEYAARAAAR